MLYLLAAAAAVAPISTQMVAGRRWERRWAISLSMGVRAAPGAAAGSRGGRGLPAAAGPRGRARGVHAPGIHLRRVRVLGHELDALAPRRGNDVNQSTER